MSKLCATYDNTYTLSVYIIVSKLCAIHNNVYLENILLRASFALFIIIYTLLRALSHVHVTCIHILPVTLVRAHTRTYVYSYTCRYVPSRVLVQCAPRAKLRNPKLLTVAKLATAERRAGLIPTLLMCWVRRQRETVFLAANQS